MQVLVSTSSEIPSTLLVVLSFKVQCLYSSNARPNNLRFELQVRGNHYTTMCKAIMITKSVSGIRISNNKHVWYRVKNKSNRHMQEDIKSVQRKIVGIKQQIR